MCSLLLSHGADPTIENYVPTRTSASSVSSSSSASSSSDASDVDAGSDMDQADDDDIDGEESDRSVQGHTSFDLAEIFPSVRFHQFS